MESVAALDDVGDCRLCGGDLKHVSSDGNNIQAKCVDCGTEHQLQGKVDDGAHRVSHLLAQASKFTERDWRHLAAIEVLADRWDDVDAAACPTCGNTGKFQFHYRGSGSEGSNTHTRVECQKCKAQFNVKHSPTDKYASLRYASLRWEPQFDTTKYVAPQMSALARRAHDVLATPEGTL